MTDPVPQRRIEIASDYGIFFADLAALACREADLPFYAACALLEKESPDKSRGIKGGANVYGHDVAEDGTPGALSGFPLWVNEDNYMVFRWMVIDECWLSNGVGPCQITWAGKVDPVTGKREGGFFTDMERQGLKPWAVYDNMLYGFKLLAWLKAVEGTWILAGKRYNGALSYGLDLDIKIRQWKQRFSQ